MCYATERSSAVIVALTVCNRKPIFSPQELKYSEAENLIKYIYIIRVQTPKDKCNKCVPKNPLNKISPDSASSGGRH